MSKTKIDEKIVRFEYFLTVISDQKEDIPKQDFSRIETHRHQPELRKTWVSQKRNRAILREMTFANDCANCCFFAQNWCAKKEKFCVSFRKNCAKVLRMETLGQTKRAEINLRDPLIPGWEMLCRALNKDLRRTSWTNGLSLPVELSQNKSPSLNFTVTTERVDELLMAATDAQDCWKDENCEKSKPGTEKSWILDKQTVVGGCKPVGRGYIWKLSEEVLDTLWSGEEIGLEWSWWRIWSSWKDDGRVGWRIGAKNSLVRNI